jgi:putative acetyltransferase
MTSITIRAEKPADSKIIYRLTQMAFEPKAYSDGTEADVIDKLRASGDLTLSLVAQVNTEIVGHVAFSPVTIGEFNDDWYGLGPVSVHPDHQLKGIGSALIDEGLKILQAKSAAGCALIGDPKYYSRFGFVSNGKVSYGDVPSHIVQWLSFGEQVPSGALIFNAAFDE